MKKVFLVEDYDTFSVPTKVLEYFIMIQRNNFPTVNRAAMSFHNARITSSHHTRHTLTTCDRPIAITSTIFQYSSNIT